MKYITLDFETYWDKDFTLSSMTTESYIRDARFKVHGAGIKVNNGKAVWVTGSKLPAVLEALQLNQHAMVGHNLTFDSGILAFHYGIQPKFHLDTLGISRAILGAHTARHGLQYVAEFLTGSGKTDGLAQTLGIRTLSPAIEASLAAYCINDVEKTYAVFRALIQYMPVEELKALDWTVRAFTQPKLLLDTDMLAEYKQTVLQIKADALISAGLEDRTLLMSNDKLAAALEALGAVPPTKINAKGKVAWAFAKTDEGLQALLEHDSVQVQALVAARLEVKSTIEETRTERLLDASTRGPWPVPYNYSGANVTQRHSGADKVNVQNLKRGGTLRKCIYAPEGYACGVADLAQIECRLVLWLGSQSPKSTGTERESLDVLRDGGDLYSVFGSTIYGREITKEHTPMERQVAKSAVLGLGYGMGPARFIDECKKNNIPMDAQMAERIVNLYRNTYKGVRHIWGIFDRALKLACNAAGQDETTLLATLPPLPCVTLARDPWGAWGLLRPSGLRVKYPALRVEGDEMLYNQGSTPTRIYGPKAVENTCQALAGDIIRRQINQIDRFFPCVMTTHDELVATVPLGKEGLFTKFATAVMTRSPSWAPSLPLGTEVHTAVRYGLAK